MLSMTIKDWHITERPREKLLNHGVTSLSDAELLALFLQSGTVGRSAVEVARDALAEFGGLGKLLCSDKKQFCAFSGFGEAR
jgi:DNA repair protein RadC